MDLKQIEYIVKIAETANITRASEQLFITQSALNQQLLKLENELGVKLFERHKNHLTLTDAGKVYLKYGRQILQEKREAYNIIGDLAHFNTGHFSFTFSRERGLDLFVATYFEFHKKFPHITVEPQEMSVHNQQQKIVQGYVDLGLVTLSDDQKIPGLTYNHIRSEPLLICLPRSYVDSLPSITAASINAYVEELPYLDIREVKDFPFVLISKGTTLRTNVDRILSKAKLNPYILFESFSIRALLRIVEGGIACTITSAGYYKKGIKDIAFFRIPGDPTWEVCTVYKKNTYISKAMIFYQQLIRDYYKKNNFISSKPAAASTQYPEGNS